MNSGYPPSLHRSVKHNQLKLMTRVVMVPGSNYRNCSRLQPLTTPQTGHELYPTHQKLSSCLRHNGSRHLGARCAAPQRWLAPSSERSSTGKRYGGFAGTPGAQGPGQRPDLDHEGFTRQGDCDLALALRAFSGRLRCWRHQPPACSPLPRGHLRSHLTLREQKRRPSPAGPAGLIKEPRAPTTT